MNLLTNRRVTHTLGRPFIQRMDEVVFNLGATRITRQQLADIANPFPSVRCVRRLEEICKQRGLTNLNALYEFGPTALATVEGAGETTLWVAMCLLDHAGLSVVGWFDWRRQDETVTWRTYQVRAIREEKRLKRKKKR